MPAARRREIGLEQSRIDPTEAEMADFSVASQALIPVGTDQVERRVAARVPAPVRQVGFWSAVLSTVCSLGYGLAVVLVLLQPAPVDAPPGWAGIDSYLSVFRPIQMLPLVPSLLLAPCFVTLMVSIHQYAAPERRLWSDLGLAFTLLYAGLALTNYLVQLTAVRRSLLNGEIDGLAPLVIGNPHSAFWALASAYVFMSLGMLFAAPVFTGGQLEHWIRWLFVANGATAPITAAVIMLDSPMWYLLGSLVPWCVVFTAATALMVALFWRLRQAAL
jgi:hypothetical protein